MTDAAHVLVVDDDEMLARTLADVLALNGYAPHTASNGERAIAIARDVQPSVALVDLRLPDMDGLDLASRLRRDTRDVQVVILTGNASVETAIRALRDENCEYLVKPVEPDTLMRVLRAAGDRHRLQVAESELQRSRDLTKAVFDASPLPIVMYDADDRVALWNAAAVRLFGWSEAEARGRLRADVFAADDDDDFPSRAAAVRKGESFVGLERRLRAKDGRVLDVRKTLAGAPAPDAGTPNVLAIYEDVTERHRLDQELRDAQRLDQIGHLAGGVAHDFNNLLTVIMTQSEIALGDPALTADVREAFTDVFAAAKAGADLTRQLLMFARRSPVEVVDVDVNELIQSSERLFGKLVGARIAISLNLAPDAGITRADHSQLDQVVANLFVNARDAMPDGGSLSVTTRRHREPRGGNASLEGREWVAIDVADTGTGIPDDVRQRIFEPFFTTKPRGKGTGLGLATCFGIVQRFGGAITVDSTWGLGATFHVYLPRAADRASTIVEDPSAPRGGAGSVLLVDDQTAIRSVVARVLKRDGFIVHVAGSGVAAIETAAALAGSAPPDVVIIDIDLPDGDGRDFAETIQQLLPRAALLFASGAPEAHSRIDNDIPVIEKPFRVASLPRIVRSAMERRAR